MSDSAAPLPRSTGSLQVRRSRLPWPADRHFRILSLDGGGIKGVFSAAFLASLEENFTSGGSIGKYFDLVAGTSTGGIIALGLGAGHSATSIRDMYINRGEEIFDIRKRGWISGPISKIVSKIKPNFAAGYDRSSLKRVASQYLQGKILNESSLRLLVPAFEGRYSEVAVFKTRHHPDYKRDWRMKMLDVALATSAAPSFFPALDLDGYRFVDGGVWANNPIMLAVVDALSCFEISMDQIRILSIGCGNEPFTVSDAMLAGGKWHWREIIVGAMRLQSLSATSQACLLLGPERVARVEPPALGIALDDYAKAVSGLLPLVSAAVHAQGDMIRREFLYDEAAAFRPIPV